MHRYIISNKNINIETIYASHSRTNKNNHLPVTSPKRKWHTSLRGTLTEKYAAINHGICGYSEINGNPKMKRASKVLAHLTRPAHRSTGHHGTHPR